MVINPLPFSLNDIRACGPQEVPCGPQEGAPCGRQEGVPYRTKGGGVLRTAGAVGGGHRVSAEYVQRIQAADGPSRDTTSHVLSLCDDVCLSGHLLSFHACTSHDRASSACGSSPSSARGTHRSGYGGSEVEGRTDILGVHR